MTLRERVEAVVTTPVDREAISNFDGHQEWYSDREETIASIRDGGAVVAAGSCDMLELLELAEEHGWTMREEAAEVFVIEP